MPLFANARLTFAARLSQSIRSFSASFVRPSASPCRRRLSFQLSPSLITVGAIRLRPS